MTSVLNGIAAAIIGGGLPGVSYEKDDDDNITFYSDVKRLSPVPLKRVEEIGLPKMVAVLKEKLPKEVV